MPRQVGDDDGGQEQRCVSGGRLGRAEGEPAAAYLGELTDDPDGLHVQVDVTAAKRCQFTPSQAREHCQQHQRPVARVDGVRQAAYREDEEEWRQVISLGRIGPAHSTD